MKCQKCKAANATTHIKSIVNGELKEYMLCSDCAKKMGYTSVFSDLESDFSSFLGSFFGNALPARTQATHCDFCGTTYAEISKTGNVGCAKCYEIFGEQLNPSIRRIHGNTTHCGKHSKISVANTEKTNTADDKKAKVDSLKAELSKAIEEQNFEYAAELRDKIKELEG